MDEQKAGALAERVVSDLNSGMSALNLYLGYRLGLFKALADAGPATPAELARRTGYSERYLQEWLSCMYANEYADYDSNTGRFSLSPEQAAVLLDGEHPAYAIHFIQFLPSFVPILPKLMDAFRTGGGVPYEDYGQDCLDAIALGNRPMYIHDYASKWIPALPDIEAKLRNGGKVLEVGCGLGWSSIALARGFPRARIDAVDIDEESIRQARQNARQEGVSGQITFHHAPIEKAQINGPYDLVTAFECLHDMPYPVDALRHIRELASPGGVVLLADEAAGDSLEENRNFLGQFFYNFSVLHCLPQAMVFPNAAGTGTAISPSSVRRYAAEAGFKSVEVAPIENPFWRFYRLTP